MIRVAILGDFSTQLFAQSLRDCGRRENLEIEIFRSGYDQMEREVLDPNSGLYSSKPQFVILFETTAKLAEKFYRLEDGLKKVFAENCIKRLHALLKTINEQMSSSILYCNFTESPDEMFGNFANKFDTSFLYQIRKINCFLMDIAQKQNNFFVNDVSVLYSRLGQTTAVDSKLYVTADIPFSLDFLGVVAKNTINILKAQMGLVKKCLVFDLDDTIWGGILAEEGIENIQIGNFGIGKAFSRLQLWMKQLKERGILLAVCSKNEESVARQPFLSHKEMILRLEDISVFMANWNNKAKNIHNIRSVLNIGLDSMVFLDDSPFERNLVRSQIPEICVPELPEDPSEYVSYLSSLNLFESSTYSEEDKNRTKQYQQEVQRVLFREQQDSLDSYLKNLKMRANMVPVDRLSMARVAQLTQRSNQFHLRTTRYTEGYLAILAQSADYGTLAFELEDIYGYYGLISVVILQKQNNSFFIDTWVMSCRVLKRGVEEFIMNAIISYAKNRKVNRLVGEYIPTAKNGLMKDILQNMGFTQSDAQWILEVENYVPLKTYVA